jgi:hypothetical protein
MARGLSGVTILVSFTTTSALSVYRLPVSTTTVQAVSRTALASSLPLAARHTARVEPAIDRQGCCAPAVRLGVGKPPGPRGQWR